MSDDHNLQHNPRQQHSKINEATRHSKTEQEDHTQESPNTERKIDANLVQEGDESCKNAEECRTPSSEESKIPRASSCPPAPRRKRREEEVVISHKRKLNFFEDTVGGAEEIESLFESTSSPVVDDHVSRISTSTVKRRRRSR